MKPSRGIMAAMVAFTLASASAQSYVTLRADGATVKTLTVPTNTVCRLIGAQTTGLGDLRVQFPGAPTNVLPTVWNGANAAWRETVIGPCVMVLTNGPANTLSVCHFEMREVQTVTPASLVAPAGTAAALIVETSTNLNTWQTVTNAAFPRSDRHRFFRTRLEVR